MFMKYKLYWHSGANISSMGQRGIKKSGYNTYQDAKSAINPKYIGQSDILIVRYYPGEYDSDNQDVICAIRPAKSNKWIEILREEDLPPPYTKQGVSYEVLS